MDDEINDEIQKIEYEIELLNSYNNEKEIQVDNNEEEEEKPKEKKKKGQTRERMMELHKIRSEKARLKREEKEELKKKEEEIKRINKEKINIEYEEAQRIKEALEQKKAIKKTPEIKYDKTTETKNLYKTVSRDILKEKYLEEAKRRVMIDLFS